MIAAVFDLRGVHAGVTKKAMVYFSQETKQRWSSGPAEQELAGEQGQIDGGALWLPGNTLLELQMLPMVRLTSAKMSLEFFSVSLFLPTWPSLASILTAASQQARAYGPATLLANGVVVCFIFAASMSMLDLCHMLFTVILDMFRSVEARWQMRWKA